MQCRFAVATLGLLLVAAQALAEPVKHLYRAEVLVASQSVTERSRAATTALETVLVRVSGRAQVLEHPSAQKALKRAHRYVSEFSYETTDEQLEIDGALQPATRLVLRFSAALVEKLLREAGLPLWPANRPSLLVWLVEDDLSRGRHLVADPLVWESVRAQAAERGLPLATPLLDLQDQIALEADALWHFDEENIRAASARYGADGIVVGRYTRASNGRWLANWQLLHKREANLFDSSAESIEELVARGMTQVVEHIAGLYAIVPRNQAPDTVVVEVAGVEDFGRYIATLDYFDGLAMVRHAALTEVKGATLVLQLSTEGELSLLLDALSLDKKLLPADDGGSLSLPGSRYSPRGSASNPLQYRWSPQS